MQVADCDVSENSIKKMMEEVDTDGNGTVSFKEFCAMAKKKQKQKNDRMEKLRKAFSVFDTDGSGYVDRQELKDGLTAMGKEPLTDEEIEELMNLVDMDGDGQLSIEEFARVLTMSVKDMIEQNQPAE
ncbi:hypothetical protein BOX15_Mlig030389g1 [Macrostomum lignano]|nr:hypothetical protein BOX15_Mlig030389g1 [Macrostomum lignano]